MTVTGDGGRAAAGAAAAEPPTLDVPGWLRALVDGLASGLREVVLPSLGSAFSRGLTGRAAGGDTTFAIDELAEDYLASYLTQRDLPVAVYSEDRGLVRFGGSTPEYVLIVDPIDGTRPAAAGFEAACVSVAAARASDRPVMSDVVYGVVAEIKEGGVFSAVRGGGARITTPDGSERCVSISSNTDLTRLFWTIGFRGRPALELATALGGLIDLSSVDGAVFDIGSATYSMTRILTGQLDAYVDVGPRMIELAPWVEARFREVGKGAVLNNSPHDVAASTLILREAGCIVTDAAGRSLDDRPLLGSDMSHQMSVLACASPALHEAVLAEVARGIDVLVGAGRSAAGAAAAGKAAARAAATGVSAAGLEVAPEGPHRFSAGPYVGSEAS
ncbi:MAG TPA: inositol monophosphatase family protein [Thermoleophilia bacterium]|nr:inositol monophosphatase family protein [Thermoleophilia bacterium]